MSLMEYKALWIIAIPIVALAVHLLFAWGMPRPAQSPPLIRVTVSSFWYRVLMLAGARPAKR
jgi:hypothetical protein